MSAAPDRLLDVLRDAQARGLLGPGDPQAHIDHALAFARVTEAELGAAPDRFLDLGSGGGVPGLVLALAWPGTRVVLLDAGQRRCAFLADAAQRLDLAPRTDVRRGRAEELAHEPALRGHFRVVVARAFGPPAVTAELAAGFLDVGGLLVVSEPPTPDPGRWPDDGLAGLGLGPARRSDGHGAALVCIRKVGPTPTTRPRRTGVPDKRPLW